MYLVHARLLPHPHKPLPTDAAALVQRASRSGDGVEFVVAHTVAPGTSVLGFFVLASSLAEAETAASKVCRRALSMYEAFRGFGMLSCGTVMPAAYYERLLDEPD